MTQFHWFFYALILILGRFSLLCSLYFTETPIGEKLVPDFNRFLWHTLYAEIGFAMAIGLILFVCSKFLCHNKKGKTIIKIAAIILAAIYLTLSGTDDEIQRWMGQKLSLSFIKTYIFAFSDTALVSKIFFGGMGHFLITVGLIVATVLGVAIKCNKTDLGKIWQKPTSRKTVIALALTILFTALGCTSHLWYHHSQRRWDRIRPVVYTLVGDIVESFANQSMPENYNEGILILGGNPDSEYPFWKESSNEEKSLNDFKSRPIEEKPDIILFTIESLRGWTSDLRVEENCKRLPNLCRIMQKGLYYPNAFSVGNPSVEGLLGIMTGIISHSTNTLLRDFPNENMRSFSEILMDAGYYTEVILGADPRFDNEEGWYSKWFNSYEFKPDFLGDVHSALRFTEKYKQRPKDRPALFHWMSLSMHLPFELPKEMGETPSDIAEAYIRAESYMDSAVGLILDSIEKDPRASNTLLILTGDHSYPNGKQLQDIVELGQANDGFTWVAITFAGPGIKHNIDNRVVSQADIAPSIMSYLNLDVSNHFMGVNLIPENDSSRIENLPPVYSFRYGDMAMRQDSAFYYMVSLDKTDHATVRKPYLEPTWDTSSPVNGYSSGETMNVSDKELKQVAQKMKTAAKAWNYVIYQNRIMPANRK